MNNEYMRRAVTVSMVNPADDYENKKLNERKLQSIGIGDISNVISFVAMVACICIFYILPRKYHEDGTWQRTTVLYALSFALYSFAGGATNWLAVKMLFDKIPFIVGSGVIPRQFKAIREAVKETIMITFFSPAFLAAYIKEQVF